MKNLVTTIATTLLLATALPGAAMITGDTDAASATASLSQNPTDTDIAILRGLKDNTIDPLTLSAEPGADSPDNLEGTQLIPLVLPTFYK